MMIISETSSILAVLCLIGSTVLLSWKTLRQLEKSQQWTIRFHLSLWQHQVLIFCLTIVILTLSFNILRKWQDRDSLIFLASISAGIVFATDSFVFPLWQARNYMQLRWKAWTGPSRTGIPSSLVSYVGNADDWKSLAVRATNISLHPVEQRMFPWMFRQGIREDPTAILKARQILDKKTNTFWKPSGSANDCLYQPIQGEQSVSLLWGQDLGFQARCSRAIISVPHSLLRTWPRSKYDLDGKGICLAFGILGRNKGLDPNKLICNLQSSESFRRFEENSVFWPRPAKTLRGLYHREFNRTFGLLGTPYVTAATELALLLTDIDMETSSDWLDNRLEHQDIQLNNLAYNLGASKEDLFRLYTGHYAAMLVSLSLHRRGNRIRPEVLVYDALCAKEGKFSDLWSTSPEIQSRREAEQALFGESVHALITAIV